MQSYIAMTTKIAIDHIPLPARCTGVSQQNGMTIFWFANDDMVESDQLFIINAVGSHKWGKIFIEPTEEADTFLVKIFTDESFVTPILDDINLTQLPVTNGMASFTVEAITTFTVDTVELDNQEVTYVIG